MVRELLIAPMMADPFYEVIDIVGFKAAHNLVGSSDFRDLISNGVVFLISFTLFLRFTIAVFLSLFRLFGRLFL